MDDPNLLIVAVLALFLLPAGLGAVLSLWSLRPWLRAMSAGVNLTVFEVIGMRLRAIDVDAVVAAMRMADDVGLPLHHVDAQQAFRVGIDPSAATSAWIAALDRGEEIPFAEVLSDWPRWRSLAETAAVDPPNATPDEPTERTPSPPGAPSAESRS